MSLGLLLLRIVVGGIFVAHGYPKLFGGPNVSVSPVAARYLGQGFVQAVERGPAGVVQMLEGLGVPEPALMARVVGVVEFFGGIAIAFGWLTRPAALLLAGDMVVAIGKVHWRNGLVGPGGFEFPLSLLGGCLALLFAGPGAISLDRFGRYSAGLLPAVVIARLATRGLRARLGNRRFPIPVL